MQFKKRVQNVFLAVCSRVGERCFVAWLSGSGIADNEKNLEI